MPRILQTPVPALFPDEGEVRALILGEAPGPRGADQSGIPFWGDRAGRPLYRALATGGWAQVPERAWERWDGAWLRASGLRPVLKGVGLSNAFPRCPTSDGERFRAPSDAELLGQANQDRLRRELSEALRRSSGRLIVMALGRRAAWVLERLERRPPVDVHVLPHPSAQGLLQAAPGRGKGMRLADLERAWEERLLALLR